LIARPDPFGGLVGVVGARSILEGCLRSSVQGIVGVGRHLTLAIGHSGKIAIVIVGVGLRVEQRILPRARPVHVAIGIHRLLALGIGQGE